jgi:hypothetical protein
MVRSSWCTRERQSRPTTAEDIYLSNRQVTSVLVVASACTRDLLSYPTRSEAFLSRVRLDARIFVFPDIVLKPHFFLGLLGYYSISRCLTHLNFTVPWPPSVIHLSHFLSTNLFFFGC